MPQFEKITDVKAQYNENLLPIDFLNDNNHPWTATLAGGTITAGPQTDIYYAKKGIRIQASGTDLNDSFFALADQNHYSFTVPKSGDYIFQFAAYSNCPNNSPVEINGWLNIIEVAKSKLYKRTKKFASNFMLIAADILPVLSLVSSFKAASTADVNGPYFAG